MTKVQLKISQRYPPTTQLNQEITSKFDYLISLNSHIFLSQPHTIFQSREMIKYCLICILLSQASIKPIVRTVNYIIRHNTPKI